MGCCCSPLAVHGWTMRTMEELHAINPYIDCHYSDTFNSTVIISARCYPSSKALQSCVCFTGCFLAAHETTIATPPSIQSKAILPESMCAFYPSARERWGWIIPHKVFHCCNKRLCTGLSLRIRFAHSFSGKDKSNNEEGFDWGEDISLGEVVLFWRIDVNLGRSRLWLPEMLH